MSVCPNFNYALTYKLGFWYVGISSKYPGQGRVSRSCGQGHMNVAKYPYISRRPVLL